MTTLLRRAAVTATMAVALLAISTGSAQAMPWTQLDSTTAEEISAVEYHPDGRIWFATTNGKIFSRPPGGVFTLNYSEGGRHFHDIAFTPSGNVGLAAADFGNLYRSNNGGATWNAVDLTNGSYDEACTGDPAAVSTPSADLLAVEWSSEAVAWVVSQAKGQILKSTNGGVTWSEASRQNDGECRIEADVTDVAPIPGSVNDVYFVDDLFAGVWRTSNGLTSAAAKRENLVNCGGLMALAVDPSSPSRISAAGDCSSFLHWGFSSNGGTTRNYVATKSNAPIRDVDAGAGVFLAVGDGGLIEQTFNGSAVNAQPAAGVLTTSDWKAVDFADAARAVVGGAGGALAITDQANVPPPVPTPPTPPSGPGTDVTPPATPSAVTIGRRALTPGQRTTFGFNASEAGQAVLTFEKRFAGLKGKRKGKNVCLPKTKKRLRALRKKAGSKRAYAKLLRKKACPGYRRIGAIREQAKAGRNTIAFNGRVAGRKLSKGRYRAKLVITDAAGNTSRAETIKFKVVGKKKPRR